MLALRNIQVCFVLSKLTLTLNPTSLFEVVCISIIIKV